MRSLDLRDRCSRWRPADHPSLSRPIDRWGRCRRGDDVAASWSESSPHSSRPGVHACRAPPHTEIGPVRRHGPDAVAGEPQRLDPTLVARQTRLRRIRCVAADGCIPLHADPLGAQGNRGQREGGVPERRHTVQSSSASIRASAMNSGTACIERGRGPTRHRGCRRAPTAGRRRCVNIR